MKKSSLVVSDVLMTCYDSLTAVLVGLRMRTPNSNSLPIRLEVAVSISKCLRNSFSII